MSEPSAIRFVAFLSYAHADVKVARWLHGALEGFPIDPDLVGRTTARGPVPKRLSPIFRDREDFSGGHTLTDATIAALDASAALIVACSPVAATRHAVNEEVRLFRWRHPDRPVIPVIVDGTYPDSFPPALRFEIASDGNVTEGPVTILGADIREQADGRPLGLAKVVAGLTGLAPDDIFRRAERARRRTNRIRATIAASILALAGTGSYLYWRTLEQGTVIGSQQRTIASQDAREREIRQIVERELARNSTGEAASPNAEQDLAAAVRALLAQADKGDATARQIANLLRAGRTEEAIDVQVAAAEVRERRAAAETRRAAKDYREAAALAASAHPGRARDLYARAARLDPDDVEGLFQHAWAQLQASALDEAESAYLRILEIAKPGTNDRRIGLALYGLGDIHKQRGRLDVALLNYRRGAAIFERRIAAEPGNVLWQRDLSVSHIRIGDVQRAQHNLRAALDSFNASLAIRDRLAKSDPGNAGWQQDLSVSHIRIGDVQRAQDDLSAALDSYNAALAIRDRLAKSDPGNASWQRDLSVAHMRIGDVQIEQDNLRAALDSYQAALAIRVRLATSDTSNAGWQRDLAATHNKVGDALVEQENLPAALDQYRTSLEIMDRLAKLDPGNAGWQRDLARSLGRVAKIDAQVGEHERALGGFRRARSIIAGLAARSPNNAALPRDLAWFDEQIAELAR